LFEANVQPFVAPGCGSLDCHGAVGRPLRIYSMFGLRIGNDRDLDVTAEELAANAEAMRGISFDIVGPAHRALAKPLAEAAGGMHHVGGDLWPSADAPEYLCLSAWLSDAENDAACTEAVANAPY
jgi:hypothetical protein